MKKMIVACLLMVAALGANAADRYIGRFDPQGSANVPGPFPVVTDEGLGGGGAAF